MKRVWIASVILIITLLSSVFYVSYHGKKCNEILDMLNQVSDYAFDQSSDEISQKLDKIMLLWDKEEHHWNLLFGKDMTQPISESLHQLNFLNKLEMHDELVLEAQHGIDHIISIWEYQWVSYKNFV